MQEFDGPVFDPFGVVDDGDSKLCTAAAYRLGWARPFAWWIGVPVRGGEWCDCDPFVDGWVKPLNRFWRWPETGECNAKGPSESVKINHKLGLKYWKNYAMFCFKKR